jgi:uncharacterized protein
MDSLIEKLKSLGVRTGKDNLAINSKKKFPIEDVVTGEWLHDPLGDIFKVRDEFTSGYMHGRIKLENDFSFSRMLNVCGISGDDIALEDILFIDTETTGLSGGTGTMAFLIGLGYFTSEGFIVDQYFLDDPANELSLMNTVSNQINPYKLIVSYNGSSFDLPLLRTRFVMNRLPPPFNQMSHLDLLHLSRKIWKLRLSSLRLKDIENEVLNFYREEEEVPGWMVPQIYFDFIRSRDARPLGGVFYHNRMDVLSLAFIFNHLSSLINHPLEEEKASKEDVFSIARIFEKNGYLEESTILFRSTFKDGLPENIPVRFLFRIGKISKRHKNIEMALEFWRKSFERGDYEAAIEISKYYEHQLKDYGNAKYWCKSSLELFNQNQKDNKQQTEERDKIKNRLKRIEQKLQEKK